MSLYWLCYRHDNQISVVIEPGALQYVDRLSKKQQAGPQRSACEHNGQRRNAQEQAGKKAGTDGGDPARGKSEYSRPNEDQGTVLLKRRSPCIMRLPDLGTKSISHKNKSLTLQFCIGLRRLLSSQCHRSSSSLHTSDCHFDDPTRRTHRRLQR
jgi:hypothetical protein